MTVPRSAHQGGSAWPVAGGGGDSARSSRHSIPVRGASARIHHRNISSSDAEDPHRHGVVELYPALTKRSPTSPLLLSSMATSRWLRSLSALARMHPPGAARPAPAVSWHHRNQPAGDQARTLPSSPAPKDAIFRYPRHVQSQGKQDRRAKESSVKWYTVAEIDVTDPSWVREYVTTSPKRSSGPAAGFWRGRRRSRSWKATASRRRCF